MLKVLKKGVVSWLAPLLLLMAVLITFASAFGQPPPPGQRPPNNNNNNNNNAGQIHSVAEPATIVLLGAGLVSLGFYAKKKRGNKR